jgi:GTP-binding protein Era
VSALKADGLDVLLRLIVEYLPEGPPYHPEDTLTDMDERSLVAERIRERIFHLYREEIPYSAAVEIEEFIEKDPAHGGKDYIRATIYVERDSQKGILIGKGGEKLRKVGTQVRKEIEFLLGRPVYLELWVKVFPKWRQNPAFLKRLGL